MFGLFFVASVFVLSNYVELFRPHPIFRSEGAYVQLVLCLMASFRVKMVPGGVREWQDWDVMKPLRDFRKVQFRDTVWYGLSRCSSVNTRESAFLARTIEFSPWDCRRLWTI